MPYLLTESYVGKLLCLLLSCGIDTCLFGASKIHHSPAFCSDKISIGEFGFLSIIRMELIVCLIKIFQHNESNPANSS